MKLSANKKKIIVLCSMVLLLVIAGTLNVVLSLKAPGPGGDGGGTVTTFFSSYKADREAKRAEQMAYLDSIIASPSSTKEAVAAAEKEKSQLCVNIEAELVLEGLIKARGYEDAVVTMGTTNLNVIIKDKDFNLEDAAKILGIITSETSYTPTQVVIAPYVETEQ